MKKLINLFEEDLRLNPDTSFEFDIDSNDSERYWDFIAEYILQNGDKILYRKGQVVFVINGDNIDTFLCGVAPIWKEYEDKAAFEYHYISSDMMRELYCNERDKDGNLIPLYISLNGNKKIVTWQSDKESDIFTYRAATYEERGLLDVLYYTFGGMTNKDTQNNEYKFPNPHIKIRFGKKISNSFGFDLGYCKNICDHINALGFSINGNTQIDIG